MAPALLAILEMAACGKPRVVDIATIEEADAPLQSSIQAHDPAAGPQFASGFYPAEGDGWRWARRHFAVVLQAPAGAKEHGAVLELKWDAPQAVLDQIGPVTLSASVGGVSLPSETRHRAGPQIYRRVIAASAFPRGAVLVNFSLDKVVAPFTNPADDRELGVAVHAAALLPNPVASHSSAP